MSCRYFFEPAGVSRRTGHPQVKVPGIRATIDANIAPYIKTLKDRGFHTTHSCGYDVPYISGQTPDRDVILGIRYILKKQGFFASYDSEQGGLVFHKYDNTGLLLAIANADYYKRGNEIRKEMGLKVIDEYEWSINSFTGRKGMNTIIKPFVDAVKEYFIIPKFMKGGAVMSPKGQAAIIKARVGELFFPITELKTMDRKKLRESFKTRRR